MEELEKRIGTPIVMVNNQLTQDCITPPSNNGSHIGSPSSSLSGVSNCYVFKSRLQEYAQKVGLPTPVYETIKDGPSHEPSFRSTVIVNDIRYDSLPGFFNRKAAEQSAAEVALMQLAKSGNISESISVPVHETGLCKNLLQEYAQKMNYAIPSYHCQKIETPGRLSLFSCTVEIGGIRYIGASARTKKEAEIKAARTAILAIQSSPSRITENPMGNSMFTVVPTKRKVADSVNKPEETAKVLKPNKKCRFKKKHLNKNTRFGENTGIIEVELREKPNIDRCEGDTPNMNGNNAKKGLLSSYPLKQSEHDTHGNGISAMFHEVTEQNSLNQTAV